MAICHNHGHLTDKFLFLSFTYILSRNTFYIYGTMFEKQAEHPFITFRRIHNILIKVNIIEKFIIVELCPNRHITKNYR